MKARIYFKDSVNKPSLTVEGVTGIRAACFDGKSHNKNYDTEEKLKLFTPFAQESYAFAGKNGIFSVAGADILYVEFIED